MKGKKFLTLINDERKERHILSAKGCTSGASDSCYYEDRASCSGAGTSDICSYDYAACKSGAYDSCGYDYK